MSNSTSLFIAPFKTGLDTDIQPWLAPVDSFTELNNFHVEHGYLEKRNGYLAFGPDLDNGTAVIGFATFIETASGAKTLLAFDILSAYTWSGSTQTWTQLTDDTAPPNPEVIFSGNAVDYIWHANWLSTGISKVNRLYFTNGLTWNDTNRTDGIWYYSGAGSTTVTAFLPTTGGSNFLVGAKLIFSIGQRLVVLYTYEATTLASGSAIFPQRARWCAKQNPDNWDDTVAGGGDFADAATADQIISARVLQNQLIVFFTDSVWALVPTSDPNKAFRWQQINSFRACGGKMASASFDRYVAALGTRGITGTDGVNTTRVDERISDFTIDEISQEDFDQTFCLRDFNNRRWWSLYNNDGTGAVQGKTNALIYDDESGAYSTYTIHMNCLGYGSQGFDYQLDEFTAANGFIDPDGGDIRLIDFNEDQTIVSFYFQKDTQLFIGGGYAGQVYTLESSAADDGATIECDLLSAAWNPYKEEGREALMPYIDILVETSPITIGEVSFYKDTQDTPYSTQQIDFMPHINFISRIVNITQANPCNVNSPSHGRTTGDGVYIYHVAGMDEVNSGEEAVAYIVTVVDENNFTLDGTDSTGFDAYLGGGEIYENPFYRTKTWKRAFAGGIGFQHRVGFTSTGKTEGFRIHAFKPAFKPRGRREID